MLPSGRDHWNVKDRVENRKEVEEVEEMKEGKDVAMAINRKDLLFCPHLIND